MNRNFRYIDEFRNWTITISVVVLICSLSFFGLSYYERSELDKLRYETEIVGEQIKLRLESWFEHKLEVVGHMALLSKSQNQLDSSRFKSKAAELIHWFPGLQALNWVDENWVIQIVVPPKGNQPALGKSLKKHKFRSVQETLSKVEKTNQIARTTIIELLQGGAGFATYWPVHARDGELLGYINGVFKVDQIVESCLSDPMIKERFDVMFYEDNKLVYTSNSEHSQEAEELLAKFPVLFVDKYLRFSVMPTETLLNASSSFISSWILGITFMFSLGLGFLLRKSLVQNQRMRASEERFRTVVENAGDAFYIVSLQGKIVDINQQACTELQYTKEEFETMTFRDIDENANEDLIREKIRSQKGAPITFESTHIKKDGSCIPVELRIGMIEINNEEFFLCLSRNISESKKLHELESRNQRLKTAGEIAGQVAHDFNNLLAPLVAYPEFINELLDENHPARELLSTIENSATQIADINQQLLTLGRRGHFKQRVLDLNKLVKQVVGDDMKLSPEKCQVTTNFDNDLMPIKGGYSQIVRIVTNLLHNAFDAIDENGTIKITTENYYLDENMANYFSIPLGEYVKITFADTGHGIPANILPTIFDPFVSTKKADSKKGSGLGLSIVQSVMKDHNGFVDVNSTVNDGTEFYLYFPISRESIQEEESSKVLGGDEKILVIDDDEMVLEVTQKILESLGYNTKTAISGEIGLNMMQNENFELLLLDMIIPDAIDGTETFKRALQINSSQKAIVVSGYAESERVNEAIRLGVKSFVKKPYTKETIGKEIRKALQSKSKQLV